MASIPLSVRALATAEERETHCQFADQAFSREPSPESARKWYRFVTTLPGYRPEQLRGAFCAGEQVGSYLLSERILHVGTARLLTGCIGTVVTYPAYRRQGVATALMQDALAYAQARHYPLLLLDGIPKFYYRYGYDDVFDVSVQDIDRAAILAQPPSALRCRPVTPEDAEPILSLYNRHFAPLTGSFTRSVAWQRHWLQYRSADNPLWCAVDMAGRLQGYLALQGVAGPLAPLPGALVGDHRPHGGGRYVYVARRRHAPTTHRCSGGCHPRAAVSATVHATRVRISSCCLSPATRGTVPARGGG